MPRVGACRLFYFLKLIKQIMDIENQKLIIGLNSIKVENDTFIVESIQNTEGSTPVSEEKTVEQIIKTIVEENKENEELNEILDSINMTNDIEENKSETTENTEGVNPETFDYATEENLPQPTFVPATYEINLPRDYWESQIVPDLGKYGLPPSVNPTDFMNYLVVNREKLQAGVAVAPHPMVEAKEATPIKKKFSFRIPLIIGGVALVIGFGFWFFRKSTPKIDLSKQSWI
jgi:hypothetical protein